MTRRSCDIVRTTEQVVRTDRYVVVVPIEVIVPNGDPMAEECFEPHTLQFLVEVEKRAEAGDLPWLMQHGRVYQLLPTSKAG